MNLFDITHTALERAISGSGMRQEALANNIANANTPGYRRQDLDFHSALRGAMESGSDLHAVRMAPSVDTQAVMRADGSSVDVDVEAAGLAKNGLEYESLVTVARTRVDILRAAMGHAQG